MELIASRIVSKTTVLFALFEPILPELTEQLAHGRSGDEPSAIHREQAHFWANGGGDGSDVQPSPV